MLSRVRPFCNSMGCSLPGSSVYGIFQAIVLEWIATLPIPPQSKPAKIRLSSLNLFPALFSVSKNRPSLLPQGNTSHNPASLSHDPHPVTHIHQFHPLFPTHPGSNYRPTSQIEFYESILTGPLAFGESVLHTGVAIVI